MRYRLPHTVSFPHFIIGFPEQGDKIS